jgi:glycerophosphoryl diester phosphodiesterase
LAKALAEVSEGPKAATDDFEDGLRQELATFKDIISETPEDILKGLVAHRGFHSTKDSVTRPVENSLPAYEQAWAMGVHFCECDVKLTSDGWLVLNHDDNMDRLALNPGAGPSQRPVGDLSLREIVSSPLKSGVRPPLLKEILDSAVVLGLPAQLVIELKPSSFIVGRALAKFLAKHRELLPHVAVVMSFDLYIMHEFAREFKHALGCEKLPSAGEGRPFMLLLTVLEIEDSCEVSLKLEEDSALDKVQKYLQSGDSVLDGVYMEWSPRLLSEDADALANLCQKFIVGVWQYAGQPDDCAHAARLMQLGVRFVNTDLPKDFARPCQTFERMLGS